MWGSFLNQLVDRTPQRVAQRAVEPSGSPAVDYFRPARSLCLKCREPIPWRDNIPVVSYLLLAGRCRSCGASIGMRTLTVEVATPIAFGAATWTWHVLRPGQAPPPGLALSALALLSTVLLAVPLLMERRRLGPALWMGALTVLISVLQSMLAVLLSHA